MDSAPNPAMPSVGTFSFLKCNPLVLSSTALLITRAIAEVWRLCSTELQEQRKPNHRSHVVTYHLIVCFICDAPCELS